MANMSQILTFDLNLRLTFPPEDFLQHMENPFPLDLRMADHQIKDNEEEIKVFCMFERLMGFEKLSKWANFFNIMFDEMNRLLRTLFGREEMIVSCVHCLGERR